LDTIISPYEIVKQYFRFAKDRDREQPLWGVTVSCGAARLRAKHPSSGKEQSAGQSNGESFIRVEEFHPSIAECLLSYREEFSYNTIRVPHRRTHSLERRIVSVNLLIYIGSFILTFLTTTLAGVQWLNRNPLELTYFSSGLPYSLGLLFVLLSHEMGHFVAARIHKVDTTYPFFIPLPAFLGISLFGTLGAVIKIRQKVPSKKALFDIGAAGPIAGFIASLIVLIIGFLGLPEKEYLYTIHPEYANLAQLPTGGLTFGNTLGYTLAARLFAPFGAFVPPMNEVYHYPFLCVGWFGMLVTALNMIPVGQLDGGHIAFCMFGRRYHVIAQVSLVIMTLLGLSSFLPMVGIDWNNGWAGWLFWALLLALMIRFGRVHHPSTEDETPIDQTRYIIGLCCWFIFVVSFSPNPISL
jgi:membrane-associated protease RseP (regulator of RpoE activity)